MRLLYYSNKLTRHVQVLDFEGYLCEFIIYYCHFVSVHSAQFAMSLDVQCLH